VLSLHGSLLHPSQTDYSSAWNLLTAGTIARFHFHSMTLVSLPGILVKLELQLSFLIDDELRGREESTVTLAFVVII
jgi:hypothetical protein